MPPSASSLMDRVQALTPNQLTQVEALVDSLCTEDDVRLATAELNEPAFAAVWNNPEDDVYDAI